MFGSLKCIRNRKCWPVLVDCAVVDHCPLTFLLFLLTFYPTSDLYFRYFDDNDNGLSSTFVIPIISFFFGDEEDGDIASWRSFFFIFNGLLVIMIEVVFVFLFRERE